MGLNMPTIKLDPKIWSLIIPKIEEEYGRTTALISWAMKRNLGFAPRNYRYWKKAEGFDEYDGYGDWVTEIHLDFDSESAATFFRLKYL